MKRTNNRPERAEKNVCNDMVAGHDKKKIFVSSKIFFKQILQL
jgi:hypothetical protein